MVKKDVIIIGAGAAGLMCGIESGKRKRSTLILDHANKPGKKILMSGGGRCNFTNLNVTPDNFISQNKHFCKSALSRYTQWNFIALVDKYKVPYHEKTLGQLFCDNKAKDILNLLLQECEDNDVPIRLNTSIQAIEKKSAHHYILQTTNGIYHCESLVIATGGLSIPTMGASPLGYQVAEQFGLKVWPTCAGLVPFTLDVDDKNRYSAFSGVSLNATVSNQRISFNEGLLFTHRGLSGPSILQISSYWRPGETVTIDLLPSHDIYHELEALSSHVELQTVLSQYIPKRLLITFLEAELLKTKVNSLTAPQLHHIQASLQQWSIKPCGTEGYRTAEVTLGGVDCDGVSSKTMESKDNPGLFFIGEVLDVTGWLGGYNFQWAWSSGWAAGQFV